MGSLRIADWELGIAHWEIAQRFAIETSIVVHRADQLGHTLLIEPISCCPLTGLTAVRFPANTYEIKRDRCGQYIVSPIVPQPAARLTLAHLTATATSRRRRLKQEMLSHMADDVFV